MKSAYRRAPLLLALVAWSHLAIAQDVVPLVTRTYAIENATVITSPGNVVDSATVVVRDGLIVDVGKNITVPYDAERISGDSLHVYSGFIDGLSNVGIPAPKSGSAQQGGGTSGGAQRPRDRGNPTNERAGIQPERLAESLIKPDDASIKGHRDVGFTVAHVVPRGNMLPGAGAVVALTDVAGDQLVRSGVSMFSQFQGSRGVYPNTVVGVMAKWRQLYREAQRQQGWTQSYDDNPTFLERPPSDKVHAAFFPVIDRQVPVVYKANSVLEIYRAMRLQDDLGFDLILAGVEQASEMIEELAASNRPVLLTLKLPKEEKKGGGKKDGAGDEKKGDEENKEAATPEKNAATYDPNLRTSSPKDVEKEKTNLEARRKETRQRYLETAAALEKAGVPFGFTTVDIKSKDVRGNVLKLVEAGLSEEAALAALTVNTATILGLRETMGTVEPGKLANLVVTSGPYFNKDAPIRYTFVDGKPFEMEEKKAAKDSDEKNVFAGTWSLTIVTPDGDVEGNLTLSGSGSAMSGTISGEGDSADLEDLSIESNTVNFTFDWPGQGMIVTELEVSDDDIEGTMTLLDGTVMPVMGSRSSGPSDRHQ